jgi:inosine-uridine nucleoside N-ribohydrolase
VAGEPIPIVLDVDTGIDDALAIALAVESPEVDLLAVTTVAGNVDIVRTTDNTLRVLHWLGATDVPVHRGASRPLIKPHQDAAHVHGTNGLGNAQLPESPAGVAQLKGPAAIVRSATDRPGETTLVCVGPLTNLAIALNVEPELPRLLRRLVIMGGAYFNPGNITPHAEFNIFVDPEAAEQVFAAPFPAMTAVGLDASHQAALSRALWERAGASSTKAAGLLSQTYRATYLDRGLDAAYLHDPLALALAFDPSLAAYQTGRVTVTLDGDERGRTVFHPAPSGAEIASTVDVERFRALFAERFGIGS